MCVSCSIDCRRRHHRGACAKLLLWRYCAIIADGRRRHAGRDPRCTYDRWNRTPRSTGAARTACTALRAVSKDASAPSCTLPAGMDARARRGLYSAHGQTSAATIIHRHKLPTAFSLSLSLALSAESTATVACVCRTLDTVLIWILYRRYVMCVAVRAKCCTRVIPTLPRSESTTRCVTAECILTVILTSPGS